jgi:hypothetical protein
VIQIATIRKVPECNILLVQVSGERKRRLWSALRDLYPGQDTSDVKKISVADPDDF